VTTSHRIHPLIKSRDVPIEPDRAFTLFTERADEWWPLTTHSIAGKDAVGIRFETGVGGVVVELTAGGGEHVWAEVTEWDPPHRFVLNWHPRINPTAASTLEVTFSPIDGGTRITLQHSGWDRFGAEAEDLRESYDGGWDVVLGELEGFVHTI
jgi:uncharacterized protein YndB with AHSA1/START domain